MLKLKYLMELPNTGSKNSTVMEGTLEAPGYTQAAEAVLRKHTDMYDSVLRGPEDLDPIIHTTEGMYSKQDHVLAVCTCPGFTHAEFYAEITLTPIDI